MMEIKLNKKLEGDIISYCKLNKLNIDKFVGKLIRDGFTVEKYGVKPVVKPVVVEEPVKPKKEVHTVDKNVVEPEVVIKDNNNNNNTEIDIYGE